MNGYVGRFAPTPSGPLHFGSLVAALTGWLQARKSGGRWLLRIDDLDAGRIEPGAEREVLSQLEARGLRWDGSWVRQSGRHHLYEAQVPGLADNLFWCACSRRMLGQKTGGIHRATSCSSPAPCHLLRVQVEGAIRFRDRVAGVYKQSLGEQVGAFPVLRFDQPQPFSGSFDVRQQPDFASVTWSYHFANVVDDAELGISEVVRGADLIDSAPRQIYLLRLLGFREPDYLHVPVVLNPHGKKLSKQTGTAPLRPGKEVADLLRALHFLGQAPPGSLRQGTVADILAWGMQHWDVDKVPKERAVMEPASVTVP